jgi:hypothetical protein
LTKAAYRRDYSTIDHLHTVTQVLEKTNEYGIPIYMAFIDFEKAFDSFQHQAVFVAMRQHSIDEKYINILKKKPTQQIGNIEQENHHLERSSTGVYVHSVRILGVIKYYTKSK